VEKGKQVTRLSFPGEALIFAQAVSREEIGRQIDQAFQTARE
jgi:hypothetical protein